MLRETNAMMEGHFLLSSGKHSDKYFQCARLFQYPHIACFALKFIAEKILSDINEGKLKVDIVAGPAIGGIIAAWEIGRQLSLPAIFTERDENGIMVVRRGFEIKEGDNVLIVEDVVTTGKSSQECAASLENKGAVISALACIVDRRAFDAPPVSLPFYPAARLEAAAWMADDCDLCRKGVPLIKPGSRKTI